MYCFRLRLLVSLSCIKQDVTSLAHLQEQKKKELEELNAMLAELGVAPKETDGQGAEPAATGKKKKKKDKSAVKDSETAATKDGETAAANGNGVAPVQQSQPAEEEQNQPLEPVIEVSSRSITSIVTYPRTDQPCMANKHEHVTVEHQ